MFPHTEFLCEEGTWWTLLFTVAGVGHCGGRGEERGREGNRGKRRKRGGMINTRLKIQGYRYTIVQYDGRKRRECLIASMITDLGADRGAF